MEEDLSTTPEGVARRLSNEEALEIGVEAYLYAYPLVLMDVTRRQMTSTDKAGDVTGRGPTNTFNHVRAFPVGDFRTVVRPNFDTLYSSAWLDLSREPMIVTAPDTAGRYYLLPMLDMWSDVFADPGARTTGTGERHFAVVPPDWNGKAPQGVEVIRAPTPGVWVLGRTQTNGTNDYEAVRRIQDGFRITSMSAWGKGQIPLPTTPVTPAAGPPVDAKTPPMDQVAGMNATTFFTYAAELMRTQPSHINDWPVLARLRQIGFYPGQPYDLATADTLVRNALTQAVPEAQKRMASKVACLGPMNNGWLMVTEGIGAYGIDYLRRAAIALVGLGANLPRDATYPQSMVDKSGAPYTGTNDYVLHFDPGQDPPACAFWSVTLYDAKGFPVANPLNRFALGDRDALRRNPDGSLDLYIQRTNPGRDREANWLPAPEGPFNLTMRIYWPAPPALDGRWVPPAVTRTTR
ncbi:MAG: DUF1254 domain-containing protein [Pseudomonadota bacterium]|nr:DUF1254 domain-containing protein [Pseudomonadota bacterium]